jgi:hypothetical protein
VGKENHLDFVTPGIFLEAEVVAQPPPVSNIYQSVACMLEQLSQVIKHDSDVSTSSLSVKNKLQMTVLSQPT